jgi:hypothetical protein
MYANGRSAGIGPFLTGIDRQYLLIGKLAGSITSKAVAAAQCTAKEPGEETLQLRNIA